AAATHRHALTLLRVLLLIVLPARCFASSRCRYAARFSACVFSSYSFLITCTFLSCSFCNSASAFCNCSSVALLAGGCVAGADAGAGAVAGLFGFAFDLFACDRARCCSPQRKNPHPEPQFVKN